MAKMGLIIDPAYKFTPDDVRKYAQKCGIPSAVDWLRLISPDKFDGDKDAMYSELEHNFYWGISYGNGSAETGSSEV